METIYEELKELFVSVCDKSKECNSWSFDFSGNGKEYNSSLVAEMLRDDGSYQAQIKCNFGNSWIIEGCESINMFSILANCGGEGRGGFESAALWAKNSSAISVKIVDKSWDPEIIANVIDQIIRNPKQFRSIKKEMEDIWIGLAPIRNSRRKIAPSLYIVTDGYGSSVSMYLSGPIAREDSKNTSKALSMNLRYDVDEKFFHDQSSNKDLYDVVTKNSHLAVEFVERELDTDKDRSGMYLLRKVSKICELDGDGITIDEVNSNVKKLLKSRPDSKWNSILNT